VAEKNENFSSVSSQKNFILSSCCQNQQFVAKTVGVAKKNEDFQHFFQILTVFRPKKSSYLSSYCQNQRFVAKTVGVDQKKLIFGFFSFFQKVFCSKILILRFTGQKSAYKLANRRLSKL